MYLITNAVNNLLEVELIHVNGVTVIFWSYRIYAVPKAQAEIFQTQRSTSDGSLQALASPKRVGLP